MLQKLNFTLLSVALLTLISYSGYSQTKESVKARASWKSSSMKVIPSLASRSELILAPDIKGEIKDGRNSKINPIIGKGSKGDDPLIEKKNKIEQRVPGNAPELVFDSATSSSQPTDPSIGVGPNHVIAVFNTGYRIFDKSGNALTGQLSVENIFSTGGCCDLTVSYDNAADRWVLSYLFFDASVEVAVSQGPDPINDVWSVYSFPDIQDYQKLSVWSDAYYMTANVNSGTATTGDAVFALDRGAMLAGEATAQIIAFPLPGISTPPFSGAPSGGFYSPQAFNVSNDNLPAIGNAPIVYLQDDAFLGITEDHLKIWTVNVDFGTPANSVISQPTELSTTAFVSVFDGGSFSNLAQPNGGGSLDALQATIMNQAQFRKFNTHNSAVFTFTVDTDGSANKLAGIRWYELRQSGDGQPWSIYQEGTYTAEDGKHAWNGSMMMDANGNIALGYTGMGGTTDTFVSSYYAGRYENSILGTMAISETLIAAGTENIPGFRYGDYGKMDIDPNNDEKFWYINEYMNTTRSNVVGVFQIVPSQTNDIGVFNIDLPETGSFAANEEITVSIFNFGSDPVSNFDVTYQIDGGALITETFTGTIPSISSVDFTFSQTADLSIEGQTYTITATTDLATDADNSNDSTTANVTVLYANDIGIAAITAPVTGENLGSESVTVTIENFGTEIQSNFDVSYTVNGGTPVIETVTGPLDPLSTISYTFTTQADLSILGSLYEITATTLLISDTVASNDSTSVTVENQSCQSLSNDAVQSIGPDGGTITTSIINFTDDFVINDVNVLINLEHTYNGDLTIKLIAPDGATEVSLSDSNGGNSQNYTNTLFDDEATVSIIDGNAPFTGSFQPEGSHAVLDDLTSSGDWTLSIEDNFNGDEGQLLNWTMQLCGDDTPILAVGDKFNEDAEFLILDKGDNQYDISLITSEIAEQLTLNVYSMTGQKLLDYKLQNNGGQYNYKLNMSYAPSGVYIVVLTNGKNAETGRIIKR